METRMEIRHALIDDIPMYVQLGKEAQIWLQSRGLRQYVPAAHEQYASTIRARVESKTLYRVCIDKTLIAFFNLDTVPSEWWPADKKTALYLAGVVVGHEVRGRGVGDYILRYCVNEARRLEREALRLDCHAENSRLCRYYEARGFRLSEQVQQHEDYFGHLYELMVADQAVSSRGVLA